MQIQILTNGNLEMSASPAMQTSIKEIEEPQSLAAEGSFIQDVLEKWGYTEILPEHCGALTNAPLITDGKNVWGYMDYQISSFLEKLAAGEKTIWQKG